MTHDAMSNEGPSFASRAPSAIRRISCGQLPVLIFIEQQWQPAAALADGKVECVDIVLSAERVPPPGDLRQDL